MVRSTWSQVGRIGALVAGIALVAPTQMVAARPTQLILTAGASTQDAALQPDSLDDDQAVSDFEQKATSAGALGFYRDDATNALVVLVPAGMQTGFDVGALGTVAMPVIVKASRLDDATFAKVRGDLTAVPQALDQSGASMGFYFDPRTEKFEVTTTFDSTELARALGDSWTYVDYHQGRVDEAGRFDDASPFKGGGAIDMTGLGGYDCTSGFTVKNASGTRGLVTAAHCGPLGVTVYTPQHVNIGQTTLHTCGPSPSNADAMIISGKSYTNQIYVGYTQAGSTLTVTGASDPAAGFTYDYSGASTYEHDNQYVSSLTGSYWASNNCGTYWVLNLIVWYTLSTGNCDVRTGDSGGPFYYKSGSTTAGIRGMVNAYSATACYGMRYTKISSLLGYSIFTG